MSITTGSITTGSITTGSIKIGFISALQGKAIAVTSTGAEVILALHSPVFVGDIISAIGVDSKVIIQTLQQQELVIDGDETLKMSAEPAPPVSATTQAEQLVEQVTQIQQTLLDDEDFDFDQLPAPAAGVPEANSFLAPPVIEQSNSAVGTTPITTDSIPRTFAVTDVPGQVTAGSVTPPNATQFRPTTENTAGVLGEAQVNLTEDIQISVTGSVGGQQVFTPDVLNTQYGELSYNERGDWRYTLANESSQVQQLRTGDTLQESIELTANNGGRFVINVIINGTNEVSGNGTADSPNLSGDKVQSIQEDAYLGPSDKTVVVEGTLTIQGADAGQAGFVAAQEIDGTYGTAEINAQGQWQYQLNNSLAAVQGLRDGQTLTDAFSVNTLDGTRQTIQITIIGNNDTPILEGSNRAILDLSTSHEAQGRLVINDADFGQSHFQEEQVIAGRFGVGSIDQQGQWSYQVDADNPAVAALGQGARLYDTFTVQAADATEQSVIIEIRSGAAEVASANSVPVIEITSDEELLTFRASSADDLNSNLYIWSAANEAESSPALTDRIAHFEPGTGGDILQLNDLLVETHQDNNLEQYLHFSFDGQDTTIEIRPEGSSTENSHFLILNNVDLTSYGNSDHEIIHQLINNGNLDIAGLG